MKTLIITPIAVVAHAIPDDRESRIAGLNDMLTDVIAGTAIGPVPKQIAIRIQEHKPVIVFFEDLIPDVAINAGRGS